MLCYSSKHCGVGQPFGCPRKCCRFQCPLNLLHSVASTNGFKGTWSSLFSSPCFCHVVVAVVLLLLLLLVLLVFSCYYILFVLFFLFFFFLLFLFFLLSSFLFLFWWWWWRWWAWFLCLWLSLCLLVGVVVAVGDRRVKMHWLARCSVPV